MHKRFSVLESTQDYLIANSDDFMDFDVVSSKIQSNGYGRTGTWDSSAEHVYMSIKLPLYKGDISELILLSIYQVCTKYQVNVRIKLPNDVYYNKQKLSGFIVNYTEEAIIVGIGINVAKMEHHERIGLLNHVDNCNVETLIEELTLIIQGNFQIPINTLNKTFNQYLEIINQKCSVVDRQTKKEHEIVITRVANGFLHVDGKQLSIMNYQFT